MLAYDGYDEFAIRPVKPALEREEEYCVSRYSATTHIRRVMTLVHECMVQGSIPVKIVKGARAKAYKVARKNQALSQNEKRPLARFHSVPNR